MNDSTISGDLKSRPHADRRQLQQIIAGLTEGILLIDTDGAIVWANEAALAMHGATAREELGADTAAYRQRYQLRYRNHHPLVEGDYPTDRLVAGENLQGVTVEVTHTGDDTTRWVHEIRGLVLTSAGGDPDCLVLVIRDVTEQANAEERFERAFAANPAPAIICRLADLRYIKVNRGFLEMTGYDRAQVISRFVYEIDVLGETEQKPAAIELLNTGRTIPQMEASLCLPDGRRKHVIVAGQPIEIGEEACMLFTFIDLDPRRAMETALRHSEERFSKAFNLSPLPTTISTLGGFHINDANEAFLTATGYTAEEVVGHSATHLHLWANAADGKRFEQEIRQAGNVRNHELQIRTKTGQAIDCLGSAHIVTIADQPCVLTVLQDITSRKRSEVELIAAIEAVMQDASWFSRTVIEKLAAMRRPKDPGQPTAELADLTPRERDILGLICEGLTDQEIARKRGLSRNTVRNHVATVYRKIDVHRRSAAVVWARDRGFTTEDARGVTAQHRRQQPARNG